MKGTTAIEWLHQFKPQATQEELRGLLGQMLFSGEDALKQTERAFRRRIRAADFLPADAAEAEYSGARRADEPPGSGIDQRAEYRAAEVRGTVLFVTHDHDVIDEVATRIWHFKGGHVEDFKGPYADFLAAHQDKAPKSSLTAAGRNRS